MSDVRGIDVFGVHDLEPFEHALRLFLAETDARCALLCDRSGRLITAAGDLGDIDGTTFASLAAAEFSASDQLALMVGEREFGSLYHHGDAGSMYLTDVGGRAILAALFDGRTTMLGMVRLKLKTLVPVFDTLFERLAAQPRGRARPEIGAGWSTEIEAEIDRLFSER
jgi:predicted regulator of Ras-like GTPase activity (Roadblock/LC7/MglB family)